MSLRTLARVSAALLILGAPLGACGKLGQLEKPGPLNGVSGATTRKADERVRQAQDPQRPVDTIDPRDETTDPAPTRTLPIEGTGSDPFKNAPQGALTDPYANPR
jgi:hypothetical protein